MRVALIYDSFYSINHKETKLIRAHQEKGIQSIRNSLIQLRHIVYCCEANPELEEQLLKIKPQIAFNCSLRNPCVTGNPLAPYLLEKMKIPFSGSSARVCAITFNKHKTKSILKKAGIPTTNSYVIKNLAEIRIPHALAFPLFIKPIWGGCSRGIDQRNLVRDPQAFYKVIEEILQEIKQPILVEEFLPGREFSVGIIGNRQPRALPILEILFQSTNEHSIPFRSFSKKMGIGTKEEKVCSANLDKKSENEVKTLAIQTYQAIGCQDYARVDLRLNQEGKPYVLEINALPALNPDRSSFPQMAKAAGINYTALIENILVLASQRYSLS